MSFLFAPKGDQGVSILCVPVNLKFCSGGLECGRVISVTTKCIDHMIILI